MQDCLTARLTVRRLSNRETECLAWAAQGKTYQEIALLTGTSFGTVKTNLDSARFKLCAVNVTHAVALAITYGKLFMTEDAIETRQRNAERYYGEIGTVK
jgi:DNA-binding CsgD family transcriptional regulator